VSDGTFHPSYPATPGPPIGSPPKGPSRVARVLVVSLLAVLVGAYAVAAFLTRDQWIGTAERDGTAVMLTATTRDGSAPTPDELATTQEILGKRVARLGVSGADVAVDGSTLTVTVSGNGDDVRGIIGAGGLLYLRPVIQSIPAEATKPKGPDASPVPPPSSPEQERADEKALRQSTDQSIQLLALQFQATRCTDKDALAGLDDPKLPLVTCSRDGKMVYLLDRSIISGDQIVALTTGHDEQRNLDVVDVEFDSDATKIFARFTEANVGTKLAYTLDTAVIIAPSIQEPIPGGRVTISSPFTADDFHDMAATVGSGSLPLTLSVESSKPATVRVNTASTPVRIGLGAAGIVLASSVAGAAAYLATSRKRGDVR
jgi:protein-export membrane protein SecD